MCRSTAVQLYLGTPDVRMCVQCTHHATLCQDQVGIYGICISSVSRQSLCQGWSDQRESDRQCRFAPWMAMGSTSARRSSKSRRADKSKTVQKFLCRTVLFAGLMVLATLYSNLRSFDSTGQLEEITGDGARRFLQVRSPAIFCCLRTLR
jgi:hypothetical protein